MAVQTVLGKVDKSALGKVSTHEHIFLGGGALYREPEDKVHSPEDDRKITIKDLGLLRRNPLALKDNGILNNYDVSLEELTAFKKAGGGTIVDVSCKGIGRNPEGLKRLAADTGLNIVMGCGYFVEPSQPLDMETRPVESVAEEVAEDILCGVDGTGVKAGVIGEIGVGPRMHPNEAKMIAAAAMAQKKTGLGLHIHIFDWPVDGNRFPLGLTALDIAEKNGADLAKVAINHMDVAADFDFEYIFEVAKRGAWVQFDNFSHEYYCDRAFRDFLPGAFATDINRVRALKKLIEAGYLKQLLIASDTCRKNHLHSYGGWGYDHILTNIIPMMMDEGFDDATIETLYHDNPARFLDSALI